MNDSIIKLERTFNIIQIFVYLITKVNGAHILNTLFLTIHFSQTISPYFNKIRYREDSDKRR